MDPLDHGPPPATGFHKQVKVYPNLEGVHGKSDPKAVLVLHPEEPGLALVVADDETSVEEEHLLHLNTHPARHFGEETWIRIFQLLYLAPVLDCEIKILCYQLVLMKLILKLDTENFCHES